MGHGGYSYEGRQSRSISQGYTTKSREELFPSRSINSDMNPKGVTIRESRDSEEHPNSVALILGLDVTRSMGIVPHELLKDGLPKIFSTMTEAGRHRRSWARVRNCVLRPWAGSSTER